MTERGNASINAVLMKEGALEEVEHSSHERPRRRRQTRKSKATDPEHIGPKKKTRMSHGQAERVERKCIRWIPSSYRWHQGFSCSGCS